MTGRPADRYCNTFKAHFPLVQLSAGSGARPTSALLTSSASVVSAHGILLIGKTSLSNSKSAIILSFKLELPQLLFDSWEYASYILLS